MPCHDHKAGYRRWPSRSLFVTDAEELARFGLMVPPDIRLTKGWNRSLGGIPVAPIPDVRTPAMRQTIATFRAHMPPEVRMLSEYAVNSTY